MDTSGILSDSSSGDTGSVSYKLETKATDKEREGGGGRTRFDVQDHLERLLVERHQGDQAREVEVVLDEVFRDLGKVLVPGQGAEPRNPGQRVGPGVGRVRIWTRSGPI